MVVTFTGDLNISGAFTKKVENNEEIFSTYLNSEFKNSDFVVSNLEGPVTKTTPRQSSNITLKSPPNTVNYLSKRNLKVFNLANNHILDCNDKGLLETINAIKKNHCNFFGAGNNIDEASNSCILSKGKIRIALFGLTVSSVIKEGSSKTISTTKNISLIKKKIEDIRDKVNYIILNYHGGEEFTNIPSPSKRLFLMKISKIKGVDIIISHHSHTLQSYEKINNTYIFYSLGNFLFDISAHKPYLYTRESAILKFNFQQNDFTFDFIPFISKRGNIIDGNREIFNKYFKSISDFSNYKKKWRAEAYRVLFRKGHLKTTSIKQQNPKKTLQEKSLMELLYSKKFYQKSFKILINNDYRCIYTSAIIHKIKLKWLKLF